MKTRRLKTAVLRKGISLHGGEEVSLAILPADEGAGVSFIRTDLDGKASVKAIRDNYVLTQRRTTLKNNQATINTVEHLLSVFYVLGIEDAQVEVSAPELPAFDGSAKIFLEMIETAGLLETEKTRKTISIKEPFTLTDKHVEIQIEPASSLEIKYLLDYPGTAIAPQEIEFQFSADTYKAEIAPARTFVLEAEIEAARKLGLGKGANQENTVVLKSDGSALSEYRFPLEPARHKILDMLGDLFLLGGLLQAKINAKRSGHESHALLVKRIMESR